MTRKKTVKKLLIPHRNSIWWTPWVKGMWVNLCGRIIHKNPKAPIHIPVLTRGRTRQAQWIQVDAPDIFDGDDMDYPDYIPVEDIIFDQDIAQYPWDGL